MNGKTCQEVLGRAYIASNDDGWDEAVLDFLAGVMGDREENTVKFYGYHLSLIARWSAAQGIGLADFAAKDMRRYIAERKAAGIADTVRRSHALCMKAFLRFAAQERYINRSPLEDYKIRKAQAAPQYWPCQEEIEHIVASFYVRWEVDLNPPIKNIPPKRRDFFRARNIAIVAGLLTTAARPNEILKLTFADYFPRRLEVAFHDTKTDEDRTVSVEKEWVELVDEWLKVRPKKADSDRLFITEHGRPVTPEHMGNLFREQMEYAQTPQITLYTFRRFQGSAIARDNFWDAVAQMGHRNPQTTMVYLKAQPGQLRETIGRVNTLGKVLVNKSTERAKLKRII